MAAVGSVHTQLEGAVEDVEYYSAGSDVDAEGEDDIPVDYIEVPNIADEIIKNGDDQEQDPNEDEMDDDDEEDEDEDLGVGAVKLPNGHMVDSDEDAIVEDASDADDSIAEEEEEDDDSDKNSSDAESAAGEEWEGGSDEGEEAEAEVANRNNCVFCGQDEENDPCEEFEEYMACAVCGDNAHRQCARGANSLITDDDTEKWRCPDCVKNSLEPDNTEEAVSNRRSSSSKLTRDLLPAQRGASRPGSHSVFNTLILDDDPLDGSRSLRKRKSSSDEIEERSKTTNKRRKKQDSPRPRSISGISVSLSIKNREDVKVHREAGDAVLPIEDTAVDARSVSSNGLKVSRPVRSRRPKAEEHKGRTAKIVHRESNSALIISLPFDASKLKDSQLKKKRRRPPPPTQTTLPHRRLTSSHPSPYATPFYSFHERENDELKSKPYGGILSEAEADTSKTLPLAADRARFEDARQKAEDEWKLKTANAEAEGEMKGRSSQKVSGPPSKIKCINFGGYEIETWYAAPYPEEYSRNRVLYICEFCLKYMSSDYVAWRHKLKCPAKHPPGDEIYRDKSVSVFEVDGRKNPVYCQNLCLLAKLFLGSKTLYYDVEPFLFYIMTEYDELGCHFVGYFSKEKRPSSQNNVSCILTLPIHQRKGYGNLLIDFSYLLTRVERKTGSPEKPLSDMGLVSYRNYWRLILSYLLLDQKEPLSITDVSDATGMTADDIVAALEALRALVRDPVTKTYALRLDHAYFKQCIESWEAKAYVKLNPDALVWTPYIMGRSNLAHYDRAPPLPTIAPRDGEEGVKVVSPEEGVLQQQQEQQPQIESAASARSQETEMSNGPRTTNPDDTTLINLVNQPESHSGLISATITEKPPLPPSKIAAGPPPLTPTLIQPSLDNNDPVTPVPPKMNGTTFSTDNHSVLPQTLSIPPTRYEIFPPVPGTVSRRRGGWRGGPRKIATNTVSVSAATTPIRKGGKALGAGKGNNGVAVGKSPRVVRVQAKGVGKVPRSELSGGQVEGRRTRSKAVEGEVGKKSEEDEDDDYDDDEEGEAKKGDEAAGREGEMDNESKDGGEVEVTAGTEDADGDYQMVE